MQIQTMSVLVGSQACNARCPFCVSRMTPNSEAGKPRPVNWRNLNIACNLAVRCGATTAMLTGKGEPTLWPTQVTEHIEALHSKFPLVELQTNGIELAKGNLPLKEWYSYGLTTVAVSVAHWDPNRNAEIYGGEKHFEIGKVVEMLHSIGFSVRLCTVLAKGWIHDPETVLSMINHARLLKVEQLTLTPVNRPKADKSPISDWVEEHKVDTVNIKSWLAMSGDLIMQLPHGAEVFDCDGQNVCLNNCLDTAPVQTNIRNLVFHPDGHLRYDWSHVGSIIL